MTSVEALLARRRKLLARLPALEETVRASYFVRRRRCGNPRCRCARGAGHRTAYLAVTLADGTTEQISLPRELEGLGRAWVLNYRSFFRTAERVWAINRELLRRRRLDPGG